MAISLFWRVQTANFDSWLNPDPEATAQMFKPQGVLSINLYRGADDPDSVTIAMEFADRAAVAAFEAWYELANVEYSKQNPGAVHGIVDRWVGHLVPSYSGRLDQARKFKGCCVCPAGAWWRCVPGCCRRCLGALWLAGVPGSAPVVDVCTRRGCGSAPARGSSAPVVDVCTCR